MATEPSTRSPLLLAVSALVMILACILLGHWQLGRVYRPIDGYPAEPPAVPLETLVPAGGDVPRDAIARQVTVSGRYVTAGQVIVPGHLLGGQPVSWVVTPLALADRTQVLVVRGWVGPNGQALAAPPGAAVAVTGRIEAGLVLPASIVTPVGRGAHLRSGYLIRTAQSPPDPLSLQPAPADPPLVNVPAEFHLQNAIYVSQWFILAGVIALSWWRLVRDRRHADNADTVPPMEPVA